MNNNQKGFGLVPIFVIILVIATLAGTGWYIYKTNQKAKNTADTIKTSEPQPQNNPPQEDPVQDKIATWVLYSTETGDFSLSHPKEWVRAKNMELCSPGIFLVGANAQSVGTCGSESFGHMSVTSVAGNVLGESMLTATHYQNLVNQAVTVDGIKGVKQTGTAHGQMASMEVGGLPDGTKVTLYGFYHAAKNRTYTAHYTQAAAYPNVLADFDLMITKTLQFTK